MQDVVNIHGKTWKLADIKDEIAWCAEQSWELVTYSNPNDHEHCAVCYWTIGVSTDPLIGIAYRTKGNHWLCQECHTKFASSAP